MTLLAGKVDEAQRRSAFRRWRANPSALLGTVIVGVIALTALVSLVWTPYGPLAIDTNHTLSAMSASHWLGTDEYGRDTLSRLMASCKITMYVGGLSVLFATAIGLPLGIWSAWNKGWVSQLILRAADVLYGFPALLAASLFAAAFGASTNTVVLAIGIAYIPVFVRVTRSAALVILNAEYVLAARAYGRRPFAIVRKHVLPGIGSIIVAQMSLLFSIAVLAESGLDYLGLGTAPPNSSWGTMLQSAQNYLSSDALLCLWPSLAIVLCVLGFSLLSEGVSELRDERGGR
jgi:peptide/nickel transport system permease protein